MKKALLISISILLLIILAIPLSFLVYKNKIRLKAEEEVNRNIHGIATFDDLHLSILKDFPNVTLTLEKVVVTGEGHFAADTLAMMDEFDFELATSRFINDHVIEVKSAHMLSPIFHFNVLTNGMANYEDIIPPTTSQPAAPSDSSASPVSIDLNQISVENGTIVYEDPTMQLFMKMGGVKYSGKGDFKQDIFDLESEAEINSLTVDYGKVQYLSNKHAWISMLIEMNMEKNLFTFKKNNIQINHFKFDTEGSIAILDNGYDVDLKFDTKETSFRNILSLMPGFYIEDFNHVTTAGELAFNGFVKGKYTDHDMPAFLVNINVSNAMFKIDTLIAPVENIQLDLVVENKYGIVDSTIIDFKTFHMDMLSHPIHGRVKVKGYDHISVDADVFANLDLAELEKMYPIAGITLSGKVNAELKAKGKYSAAKLQDSLHFGLPSQLPSFHVAMKLTDGALKYDSLPTPIENIQLDASIDNKNGKLESTIVDIKSFHLDMGKNPIHGNIKVSGYPAYNVDADIKATVDLADLEAMYPVDTLTIKGLLVLDIVTHGVYDQAHKKFPFVDAKLNLTHGYLKSTESPEPIEEINLISEAMNATGKLSDTKLTISQLNYNFEDEPVALSGSISDFVNFDYDIKLKGLIDLEKITKIYPVKRMRLKGIIDSDIESHGRLADIEAGYYDKVKADGSIEITDFEVRGAMIPKIVRIKDALITFSPEKIAVERFKGTLGKSSISMTGDLSNYLSFFTRNDDLITGDMVLKCDTLDLNDWFMPKQAHPSRVRQGKNTTVPSTTAWQVPTNINFTFDSDIGIVKYKDLIVSEVDGEIKIQDGILSMNETGFNSLNAKFSVSGDYNTKDINHPLFDFALDVKELDINKAYREVKLVQDLAPAAADTYGQLSLTYAIKGELTSDMMPKTETLTGGGEFHIANAKINGMKIFEEISKAAKKQDINDPRLKDFVVKTEIRDNKLFVKPFSIKLSGLNTDIEGVNDISGAISYLVKIELVPIEKLKIPFHVTGTYDDPKVAIGRGDSLPQ